MGLVGLFVSELCVTLVPDLPEDVRARSHLQRPKTPGTTPGTGSWFSWRRCEGIESLVVSPGVSLMTRIRVWLGQLQLLGADEHQTAM